MITKEKFESFPPKTRGYVVYMAGCRDDEPHVPDEKNPYPPGSQEAADWDSGQERAMFEVMDGDDE